MKSSVTYQNQRIYCQVIGQGQKIFFLHGWPTNHMLWQQQVQRLKASHQTITFDWLGFGQSAKPQNHHYSFTEKKKIFQAIVSELTVPDEPFTLVAHDLGGPPAILWASENQSRVKQLILLNTILYPWSTPLDKLSHLFFQAPLINKIMVSSLGIHAFMSLASQSKSSQLKNVIKQIYAAHNDWTNVLRLKTILDPLDQGRKDELLNLAQIFNSLDLQKYLIIARKDPLCYMHMEKIAEECPAVPKYELSQCGHFIPIDQPVKLNDILIKILLRS